MNNTETPPPAPDPFEAIAQQLATIAAMLVQTAGQIANLRPGAQTPPPPEQGQGEPEKSDEPSEEKAPGTEAEPPADEPEAQPESEDSTESEPPAESPANEQEQPAPEDLKESEQDGDGEELDDAPDAPAEEQPAEPGDSDDDGEPSGETTEEPLADGESDETGDESDDSGDSDAQEAAGEGEGDGNESEGQETEAAPDGAESTENGDGSEPGEMGDAESTEAGDEPQPSEQSGDDKQPEHVESDFTPGEGSGHDDPGSTEEDGPQLADNDGRGEAAALPPDLPPLDSTLANCSPPPAPEAVPYRPLSPIARKCADILTGALGKRFALPRSDRHTGQLSPQAVARHAPDVFRRRPRREGTRPKLTVITDTSTSMSMVFEAHGQFLIDGLLEAHRRRVIDLRLYDSYRAGKNHHAAAHRFTDKSGLFSEADLKAAGKVEFGKSATTPQSHAEHYRKNGALIPSESSEGFAPALENLQGVILDSDATIIFTDGHWTDGALDKVKYQCRGVEVVGLYIPLEFENIRQLKAAARKECTTPKAHAKQDEIERAADEYHAALAGCLTAQNAYVKARDADGKDGAELKPYRTAMNEAETAAEKPQNVLINTGAHELRASICRLAHSRSMLEMNSHRSYCVETAVECAHAIVQEIARQIESK